MIRQRNNVYRRKELAQAKVNIIVALR